MYVLSSHKVPNSPREWLDIAQGFEDKCQFPQCVGAIDGKHVVMQQPHNSGSYYFNYKGAHSIIMMAVVDADCRFTYLDVGANGRVGDAAVYRNCGFANGLARNGLGVPELRTVPWAEDKMPYVCVGDAAFPLQTYLLIPYPEHSVTRSQ